MNVSESLRPLKMTSNRRGDIDFRPVSPLSWISTIKVTLTPLLFYFLYYANVKGKLVLRKVFFIGKKMNRTLESGTRLQCFRLDFSFAPSLGWKTFVFRYCRLVFIEQFYEIAYQVFCHDLSFEREIFKNDD